MKIFKWKFCYKIFDLNSKFLKGNSLEIIINNFLTSSTASNGPGAGGDILAGNLVTIWGLMKLFSFLIAYPPFDPLP